jgi:hypothetical protein
MQLQIVMLQRGGVCNTFHIQLCVVCFITDIFFFPLVTFRDSVTASFPEVTHLMCFFCVVKSCKEMLQCYSKDVQQDVLQDVHKLHS